MEKTSPKIASVLVFFMFELLSFIGSPTRHQFVLGCDQALFLIGALTGAITTPLDVIKTRLMVQVSYDPVLFYNILLHTKDTLCV